MRFKLDAAVTWTPEIVDALVGTGAVHTIDFKGRYGMEVDRDPCRVSTSGSSTRSRTR